MHPSCVLRRDVCAVLCVLQHELPQLLVEQRQVPGPCSADAGVQASGADRLRYLIVRHAVVLAHWALCVRQCKFAHCQTYWKSYRILRCSVGIASAKRSVGIASAHTMHVSRQQGRLGVCSQGVVHWTGVCAAVYTETREGHTYREWSQQTACAHVVWAVLSGSLCIWLCICL